MRIRRSDVVAIICGQHTDTASGVSAELRIAKDEDKPFFLLAGYKDKTNVRPKGADGSKMYNWTWDNLKTLVKGGR